MKRLLREYWSLIFPIALMATIFVLMLTSPTKQSSFQNGYEQGMHHAILYVQTTGEWPSYAWRHEYYNDDLQTEQDIWNTLEPQ